MKFKTQTQKYYEDLAKRTERRVKRRVNRMKTNAMNNGALAFCNDDKELEDNPYPKTHQRYQWWIDGYNEAKYLQEQEGCS